MKKVIFLKDFYGAEQQQLISSKGLIMKAEKDYLFSIW